MTLVATITTKKGTRRPKVEDFMPRWEVRGKGQTIQEMKSVLRLVSAMGYGKMTPGA